MCMKGNDCGFLHQFDKQRMPTCRFFAKYNECKEPDCPFKHSLEDVKDCNMYKLGFCIHGPNCRYRHAPTTAPPMSIADAALIGRPGHLHGAPSHTQRWGRSEKGEIGSSGSARARSPGGEGGEGNRNMHIPHNNYPIRTLVRRSTRSCTRKEANSRRML